MTQRSFIHYLVLKMYRSLHFLLISIIITSSFAIYSNTLKNGFIGDDKGTIINNTLIKDIHNLPKLFEKRAYFTSSGESSYRPFTTFTYFIDYIFYRDKAWGYHLTNIMLHAANGILLYIFLILFTQTSWVRSQNPYSSSGKAHTAMVDRPSSLTFLLPFFTALLFVTHPALTEPVNAISYREDLLVFFFYISTLIIYVKLRTTSILSPLSFSIIYTFSCLTYSLSLFAKEMAVTLPLVVYAYEWFYADKDKKGLYSILLNRCNAGYVAITIAYLWLRFYYFSNPFETFLPPWSLTERILTVPFLLLNYLKLILFPASLSADYEVSPVLSIFSFSFLMPLAAIASLMTLAFVVRKFGKGVTFGIIFFFITLMPVYNIIPIFNSMAERYIYMPIVGITTAIVLAVNRVLQTKYRNILLIILVLTISMYSIGVIERNRVWIDNFTWLSDTEKKMPNSYRVHHLLGRMYGDEGKIEEAIKHYKVALELRPYSINDLLELGSIYDSSGQFEKGIKQFEVALKFKPSDPMFYYYLGNFYNEEGRFGEAVQQYQAALKLDQEFIEARYNLGLVYLRKGLKDAAKAEFEMVLKLNPTNTQVRELIESLDERSLLNIN